MSQSPPVRVMTYNIRTGLADDGADSWKNRRPLTIEVIRANDPDLIGIQEPTREQWADLREALGGTWEGVAHGTGNPHGSLQGFFFRRERFSREKDGCFWLSAAPDQPGSVTFPNHWGPRTVVWSRLRDTGEGRDFSFSVTHFDTHPDSWLPSARVLADELPRRTNGVPALLTGDFNCAAGDEAWSLLTHEAGFRDAWSDLAVPDEGVTTFNAFRPVDLLPLDRDEELSRWLETVCSGPSQVAEYRRYLLTRRNYRIDWVLYRGPLVPEKAFLDARRPGGRLPSDHYPVIATFRWGPASPGA